MLLLAILSIALMSFDHYQTHFARTHFAQVRATLSFTVAPILYFVDWPGKMVDWVVESFSSQQALLAKNADLQAQLLLYKGRLQKFIALEKENKQLRALLQSSPRTNERVLVAQLLAVDPDPFVHQVILNKGQHDGVYVGQPVLDAKGVFGQVIEVDFLTSRVLLITDSRSVIPVQDSRNGVRGIAIGTGNSGKLSLVHMPETTDIKVGDIMMTSGMGQRFPMGFPVGTVRTVNHNPGQEFAKIIIKPSAHLRRSRLVLLVWSLSNDAKTNYAQTNVTTQVPRDKESITR